METKSLQFGNKTLEWSLDPKTFAGDNLKVIEDGEVVWSLNEALGRDECAVSCEKIDEHTFGFVVFVGMRYEVDIDKLEIIRKQITK